MSSVAPQPTEELAVFVHGMANFAHNRGTKADQEHLLRDQLDRRHGFQDAFDDSGNFAFSSSLGSQALRADVLAALRTAYKVTGLVVVARAACEVALQELERIAVDNFGTRFRSADYGVNLESGLWRLGLVFTDSGVPLEPALTNHLYEHPADHLKILSVRDPMIGVLKYDPGGTYSVGSARRFHRTSAQRFTTGALGNCTICPDSSRHDEKVLRLGNAANPLPLHGR